MMKPLLLLCTLFFHTNLYADTQAEAVAACQTEIKQKSLSGPKRDEYFKECLGTKAVAEDGTSTRMGECTLHAAEKSLKGEDKKKFMRVCVAGEP